MLEIVRRVSICEQKREKFEKAWPEFFHEYLHYTLKRMEDIDKYMEMSLEKIKKS